MTSTLGGHLSQLVGFPYLILFAYFPYLITEDEICGHEKVKKDGPIYFKRKKKNLNKYVILISSKRGKNKIIIIKMDGSAVLTSTCTLRALFACFFNFGRSLPSNVPQAQLCQIHQYMPQQLGVYISPIQYKRLFFPTLPYLVIMYQPVHSLPLSIGQWIVNAMTGKCVKLWCINWATHMSIVLVEGLNHQPLSC